MVASRRKFSRADEQFAILRCVSTAALSDAFKNLSADYIYDDKGENGRRVARVSLLLLLGKQRGRMSFR